MGEFPFDPHQDIELMDKVRNKNRRKMLLMAYRAPVRYHEIFEETGLKPGSIYHHLRVLEPLIEKEGQGVYRITETGRLVVEALEMVEDRKPVVEDGKPAVVGLNSVVKDSKSVGDQSGSASKSVVLESSDVSTSDDPVRSEVISGNISLEFSGNHQSEELLERFEEVWLSRYAWVLLGLSLFVSILLAFSGVSLIGSGIYRGNSFALALDLFAFLVASGLLYVIEDMTSKYSPRSRLSNVLLIRLVSMIPAVIVGMTVFFLYVGGVLLNQTGFNILFVVTVMLGWVLATAGISVLRGKSLHYASLMAFVVTLSDLLIGLVVVLST